MLIELSQTLTESITIINWKQCYKVALILAISLPLPKLAVTEICLLPQQSTLSTVNQLITIPSAIGEGFAPALLEKGLAKLKLPKNTL